MESVRISKNKIDFDRLQEILGIYRNYDKGTDNFFFTLEQLIKENVNKETPIPYIIGLIRHYSGSVKEKITIRTEIMTLFEDIILQKIK